MGRVFALVAMLYCMFVCAEDVRAEQQDEQRRWSVTVFGGALERVGDFDIGAGMMRDGFDARSPDGSFFGPGRDHPFIHNEVARWTVTASRVMSEGFALTLLYGRSDYGYSSGYHIDATYLNLKSTVDVAAALITLRDTSLLERLIQKEIFEARLGLGPALCFTKTENITGRGGGESYEDTKFGFLVDVSLRAPARSRLFALGQVQYRHVGSADIGPFTAESILGDSATMNPTTAEFNHMVFGVGVGVRCDR